MNKKFVIFIVGLIFFIVGMSISSKTLIGGLLGMIGGVTMGLSFFLDKNKMK
ncbi:hypothetical protein [Clostridium psychrophilum]|uniref:hypothetical protein n=1 Tax=Clostridium psychrophilum TaxID=132926 RepID=UPI001C0AC9A2|nr:hypothetical protein [Clostridium psychrophilum]MBU3182546.1 hypothetical protein [Clostridium psychrophilum]